MTHKTFHYNRVRGNRGQYADLSWIPWVFKFFAGIESKDGCWNWRTPDINGYGKIWDKRNSMMAHRYSFELFKGKIGDGLQIDHICRNRRCVNPAHLRAVTSKENTLCGNGPSAANSRKTHCKRGHEFTEENTYCRKGSRECRVCIKNQRANRGRIAA